MLHKIKKALKANKLIRFLVIPLIDKRIQYKTLKLFNIPFKYNLLDGKTIKFYPKGQIALGMYKNYFEHQELEVYQKIIKSGMTVVDAGANIGLYSLIASKLVGPKGKVFSFEPSKKTFTRLLENIKLNKCNNITPIDTGLGDQENLTLTLQQDAGNGDAERYLSPTNNENIRGNTVTPKIEEEQVVIDMLDNCLERFGVKKIDFLKIDTEGFEYYILKGASKVIQNSPNIMILLECTETLTARAKTSQKDVFDILKGHNLNIYYWNLKTEEWGDDEEGALKAGDIWACRSRNQLPVNRR
jgi:FkbM family methyltransferase